MTGFGTQQAGGSLQPQTLAALNLIGSGVYPTQGNIFFVNPGTGSDNNNGQVGSPFKTLGMALSLATAGQNDIIYLMAHSNTASQTTDYQTANLNWNKDLVHLIGVNGGPFIGQRSRIAPSTTSPSFANLFTLSANGCLIANIEFFQGAGTTNPSAASTCMTISGQRNHILNCQISGVGDDNLDDSGSNDLTISGSENLIENCYIGLDTISRDTTVTGTILSGTNTRNEFRDCHFEAYTTTTAYKFLTVATGTDRWFKLIRCIFNAVPNLASSAAPTGAIGITTMNGAGIVKDCAFYNTTQIVTADNAYVQVLGTNGLATGHLISIAQGVDAA